MLFIKKKQMCLFLVILLNVLGQNYAADLRLYDGSLTNYRQVSLSDSATLIPYIDSNKDVFLFAPGYQNDPDNGTAVKTVMSTFLQTNKTAMLLNWKTEANSILGYCDTVAKDLANALVKLIQAGMNPDITLVGHSLGATLLGLTGRHTQQQNVTIPWLYALDAARLLCSLYPQVDKTSGRTVVFVRTDPGGMGTNESTAHIDHRPNNGEYVTSTGSRLQPGCNRSYSPQEVASAGNRCSHDSAWRYFCEAMVDRARLILGQARTWFDFVAKNGTFTTTNYLWPVDPSKQGLFYCTTSASAPYGKGEQGLYP